MAAARSIALLSADVAVRLQTDGSLLVEEQIAVGFSDRFTFGFRDIPLRDGERIDSVSVREGSNRYAPGSPEAAPDLPPGTFGVSTTSDGVKVVWHFVATDEVRTFTITYRLQGVTVAYDDVVDVNVKVWGDQWEERLAVLTAVTTGNAKVLRAWGHPVWVRGDVTLDGNAARLRAIDVSAGQFVELRTIYPRSAITSTAGARVVDGPGLQTIVDEVAADVAAYQTDHDRISDAVDHPVPDRADPACDRGAPRAGGRRVRVLALGSRGRHRLRPRVRAGAADGDRAGARADAAPPGWNRRLVRVRRDAVRPDPAWSLQGRAGDDRA